MNYRSRRIEQRRQRRLGCFILATAVVTAIILASIIMAFLPPIPIVATIAFYALAVVIAGAIERWLRRTLGYQARMASMQHLKSDPPDTPFFLSRQQQNSQPDSDAPVEAQLVGASNDLADAVKAETQSTPTSLLITTCPHCKTRVAPKADGTCPACRKRFPG